MERILTGYDDASYDFEDEGVPVELDDNMWSMVVSRETLSNVNRRKNVKFAKDAIDAFFNLSMNKNY